MYIIEQNLKKKINSTLGEIHISDLIYILNVQIYIIKILYLVPWFEFKMC